MTRHGRPGRAAILLAVGMAAAPASHAAAPAVADAWAGARRIAPASFAEPALPLLLDARAATTEAPALAGPGVPTPAAEAAGHAAAVLGGARARILLRSLTLPGWGQATLGRRGSALVFGLTETAVWGTFTAFRIQMAMREDAFLRTARLLAGIDLSGRNEEWRRMVGGFASSDEYNLLVVARDAASLWYDDPEAYRAYIEANSLSGADSWCWASPEAQARYSSQRKAAQRAEQRANTVLAVAVVNRIASAVHAARVAGRPERSPRSWWFEAVPGVGEDPLAVQLRVRTQF